MRSAWYWIREYQADDADQSFRGNGKLTPEQEKIRQLKPRIKSMLATSLKDCFDNTVTESFFGSLKQERIN